MGCYALLDVFLCFVMKVQNGIQEGQSRQTAECVPMVHVLRLESSQCFSHVVTSLPG